MRKLIKNPSSTETITIKSIVIEPEGVYEILPGNRDFIYNETLQAYVDAGTLLVGWWENSFYTDPLEGKLWLLSVFDDPAFLIDGTTVTEYTPAIVTDSVTGKKGISSFMDMLTQAREFYNDESNPIYSAGFQKFIGTGGRELEHLGRTANLENIHAKIGWHQREIWTYGFKRPYDLLIYYGWLNSFNSAKNGWSNELVAQDMAKYELIVLGNGIADPSHGDYSNTSVIVPRVKALNPNAKIFGYVSTNQTLANFQTSVDQWNTLGVHGIFMDESGYDYGTVSTNGRVAFNEKVDYVHGKVTSNLCFVNAWNMDHIIGTTNDVSYPNSTYNSGLVASTLTAYDWYLLESFPINTTSYSGNNGYESRSDWFVRGVLSMTHRYTYGINVASSGIINNDNASAQNLFEFGYVSSLMFSHDAFGTSDTSYGSSSAAVNYWSRPSIERMGRVWSVSPGVLVDNNDSDVYWRYLDYGRLKIDFSTSAQLCDILRDDFQGVSRITTVTSNYTVQDNDELIVCNGTSLTITLPTYVGRKNKRFLFKNINSSTVTLQAQSGQNIDSANTKNIPQWTCVEVIGHDSLWLLI